MQLLLDGQTESGDSKTEDNTVQNKGLPPEVTLDAWEDSAKQLREARQNSVQQESIIIKNRYTRQGGRRARAITYKMRRL